MLCSQPRDVSTLHALYTITNIHLYKHIRNTEPENKSLYYARIQTMPLEPANTITHKHN